MPKKVNQPKDNKATPKKASKPINKATKVAPKKGKSASPSEDALLELALIMDCTGSMTPWITRAK
jgi:hypothetical protein